MHHSGGNCKWNLQNPSVAITIIVLNKVTVPKYIAHSAAWNAEASRIGLTGTCDLRFTLQKYVENSNLWSHEDANNSCFLSEKSIARKDNYEDHHVQKPSADCNTYRFIEYLDERSDDGGGGSSHGVDVTNAEADDNEEDEAGYGADVDRPDDCPEEIRARHHQFLRPRRMRFVVLSARQRNFSYY